MTTKAPVARYQHKTPPDGGGWKDEPVGDDLLGALEYVLDQLDQHMCASRLIEKEGHYGTHVLLFVIRSGVVHVVGASPFSDRIRCLLGDGAVDGWRLHELPEAATPLDAVHAQLGNRVYNQLARDGFATLEEAAAVPDHALRKLRGMGSKSLAILRGVVGIPDPRSLSIGRPANAEVARERWRYLNEHMQVATVERYRELVDALARSSIPMVAVEKISEALDNEPVPPADPTVTMLLETAREAQLLDHYLRTHRTEL